MSEDPTGLPSGINPYVFAGNDPINNFDPYGYGMQDRSQVQMDQVLPVIPSFTSRKAAPKAYCCDRMSLTAYRTMPIRWDDSYMNR